VINEYAGEFNRWLNLLKRLQGNVNIKQQKRQVLSGMFK
jgi:hypothetical protein